jgi:hypothetical protein
MLQFECISCGVYHVLRNVSLTNVVCRKSTQKYDTLKMAPDYIGGLFKISVGLLTFSNNPKENMVTYTTAKPSCLQSDQKHKNITILAWLLYKT